LPRAPKVPFAPRTNVGTQIAAAMRTAMPSAAPINVSDTPAAPSTDGNTSAPLAQEVPRSPRTTPPSHRVRRLRGPASRPSS
jgi:hypothetical protein